MDLSKLNVEELSSTERKEVDGGFPFLLVAIGSAIVGGVIGYFTNKGE